MKEALLIMKEADQWVGFFSLSGCGA